MFHIFKLSFVTILTVVVADATTAVSFKGFKPKNNVLEKINTHRVHNRKRN